MIARPCSQRLGSVRRSPASHRRRCLALARRGSGHRRRPRAISPTRPSVDCRRRGEPTGARRHRRLDPELLARSQFGEAPVRSGTGEALATFQHLHERDVRGTSTRRRRCPAICAPQEQVRRPRGLVSTGLPMGRTAPSDAHRWGRYRVDPVDRASEFGATRAAETRNPEHLAGPNRQRDIIQDSDAGEVLHLDDHLAEIRVDRAPRAREFPPDHHRDQGVMIGVGDPARRR